MGSKEENGAMCHIHAGQILQAVCSHCQRMVCFQCMLEEEHSNKAFVSVEKLAFENRKIIKNHLDLLRNAFKTPEEIFHERKQKQKEIEHDIDLQAFTIKQKVSEVVANLKADLTCHFENEKKLVDEWEIRSQPWKPHAKRHYIKYARMFEDGCSPQLLQETAYQLKNARGDNFEELVPPSFKNPELIVNNNIDAIFPQILGSLNFPVLPIQTENNLRINQKELSQSLYFLSQMKGQEPIVLTNAIPIDGNKFWAVDCAQQDKINLQYKENVILSFKMAKKIERICTGRNVTELYGTFFDKTIKSINVESGLVNNILNLDYEPYAIHFSSGGHFFVSQCGSGPIRMYNSRGQLKHQSLENFWVYNLYFDENSKRLVCCQAGQVCILNADLSDVIYRFESQTKNFSCLTAVFHTDGRLLIADYTNKELLFLSMSYDLIRTHNLRLQPYNIRIQEPFVLVCDNKGVIEQVQL